MLWKTRKPHLPFQERDWALIAQFENRTGEDVFDGTVEHALERELINSRFVNVVPRDRVIDSLRLMNRPLDTIVDRETAREVCVRDGGIRALIAGRIEKLDSTYVISADLVNPATGVTVRTFGVEAAGQRQVVRATRELSRRVREALGEELAVAVRAEQKLGNAAASVLERVSTPSLRALHIYSQAYAAIGKYRFDQAVPLLTEAVRDDPDFASAHIMLAHSLSNLGRDAEAGPHFQRAWDLSERTSDQERLFILASCYQRFFRDQQKATETLEILLRLYPDHYWACSNLIVAYQSQNRFRDALPWIVRRADLRPRDFDNQMSAAQALAVWGDPDKGDAYANAARSLIAGSEADDPLKAWRAARLRLYPAQSRRVRGQLKAAFEKANTLAAGIDSTAREERGPLQWELGSFYLNLGMERAARQMFESMPAPPDALIAFALGDGGIMKQLLQIAPASHRSAILLARAGLIAEAEKAMTHPELAGRAYAPYLPALWDALARGEIAMARGRPAEAIPPLTEAIEKIHSWPMPYFVLGADSLSRAWEQEGDPAKSIAALEDTAPLGAASVFWGPAPLFWMKNELRRAELYRRAGREAEARNVEAGLAKLLLHADPEFSILRELKTRSAAGR